MLADEQQVILTWRIAHMCNHHVNDARVCIACAVKRDGNTDIYKIDYMYISYLIASRDDCVGGKKKRSFFHLQISEELSDHVKINRYTINSNIDISCSLNNICLKNCKIILFSRHVIRYFLISEIFVWFRNIIINCAV